jgi:cysteine synthase A
LGLAVGISSGANVIGAMKLAAEPGDDATIVTLLPDSNKKYLSTGLRNVEPPREDYISSQVQLKNFTSVR